MYRKLINDFINKYLSLIYHGAKKVEFPLMTVKKMSDLIPYVIYRKWMKENRNHDFINGARQSSHSGALFERAYSIAVAALNSKMNPCNSRVGFQMP
jgi:hypothetical protein